MNDLYKSLCDLLGTAFKRIGTFIYHNPVPVLAGVVAVLLSVTLWTYYRESSVRHITVYVGTPGTSSYRIKDRVSTAIEGASLVPGYTYQVNIVPTQGYIEIKDRLERDTTGQAIGMLVDGMNSTELRTLLPMDWDYLHILARVNFLESCRDQADPTKKAALPRQFSEIVPHLGYGRVYAGPESSGTRKFAEMLFNKHQLGRSRKVLQEVLAPGLSDWTQAIVAFKEGKIDLAFYCGPLGATTIEQICDDQSAVLVGIEDLRSGLIKADSYSVIEGKIPEHYYSAAPFVKTSVSTTGETTTITETPYKPPVYFNEIAVDTIAARRLIVTSRRMSDSDAFAITRALAKALIEARDVPEDTWLRKSPDSPPEKEKGDFGILLHHGAKLIRDDQSLARWWDPTTWNRSLLVFLSGFFAVAVTAALQQLAKRVSELPTPSGGTSGRGERTEVPAPPPSPPPPAVAAVTVGEPTDVNHFHALFAQYSRIRKRLDLLVTPSPADNDSLVADLLALLEAIDTADARHEITPTQAKELMFDWRVLKRDIQLLKAVPAATAERESTAPQHVD